MSCEYAAGRIGALGARLSAGISQLASKRGFYAGLAVGGLGLLGAGLTALARRRSDPRQQKPSAKERPALIDPKQIPELPARTRIAPTRSPAAADRCETCQTPAQSKPGPWYTIGSRPYYQDCAPAAARKVDVDLVSPARPNGEEAWDRRLWAKIDAAGADYFSPERRVETRRVESRVGLNLGSAAKPVPFVVNKGYVLVRPDGRDTGLALTPNLVAATGAGGRAQFREDPSRWWLTHIPSGRAIVAEPYKDLKAAHMLGNILAQMDWTRSEAEITPAEYRRAEATVAFFNRTLDTATKKEAAATRPAATPKAAGPGPTAQAGPSTTQRLPEDQSMTGKLVADGYGGVSRVLADEGDTLFLIDSLGKRYEVARNETRTPDESDFEMCRVAMSFDPAQQPDCACATCRRSSSQTGDGEKWYKMGWKAFCQSCATEYAANEGYIKDEEVDEGLA